MSLDHPRHGVGDIPEQFKGDLGNEKPIVDSCGAQRIGERKPLNRLPISVEFNHVAIMQLGSGNPINLQVNMGKESAACKILSCQQVPSCLCFWIICLEACDHGHFSQSPPE